MPAHHGALSMLLLSLFLVPVASSVQADTSMPPKPAAEVNGEVITEEEIDKALAVQVGKLQEQIYNLRRQRLDVVVRERLFAQEAARRGISVPKLLDAEVTSKVALVSEEEIDRFLQANKSRFGADVDESQVRDQIRSQLQTQKVASQREAFAQSLRRAAKVNIKLEAPPVVRVDVPIEGAPVRGGIKAQVTIVEFSDFHCPFCKRVLPTIKEIETRYGEKVKLAFRDFPLEQLHPGVRKAHEAARCAAEQGRFWAYHDVVFDKAPRASQDDLKTYARDVGLDVAKFEQCFGSGRYKDIVQKDIDEGARLGVNGTPTFFVNGQMISGAQSVETFARLIDRELERVQ